MTDSVSRPVVGVLALQGGVVEHERVLDELGEKYDVSPTAIAAAWIFRHPANIQLVAGTTNQDRMAQIVRGSEITLERSEWYRLYLAAGNILP